jgi:hypothetical protein
MLVPRFVGDGNENLIWWGYFTRKWVRMLVSFLSENEKRKRSFFLPFFGHKTLRLWFHSPEFDDVISTATGEDSAIWADG